MNKIKIYLLFLYIVLSLHAQPRYVNSLLASYTDSTTPLTNTCLNSFYGAATLFNFNSDIYSSIIAFQEVNPQPNSTAAAVAVKLFKNINGNYVDMTYPTLGNITMYNPGDWVIADLNGDGLPDLLVADSGLDASPYPGGQTRLFTQTSNGLLKDKTSQLPQVSSFTHALAVGDIDGKGTLDIYMSNIGGANPTSCFYMNDGKGNFTAVYDRIPSDIVKRGRTAACLVDINNDGYPDLVLGGYGDSSPNEVLINNGKGYFNRDNRYVLPPKLLGTSSVTTKIITTDINSDGIPDLVLCTTGGYTINSIGQSIPGYQYASLQILIGQADGTFIDITPAAGIIFNTEDKWVTQVQAIDINGDGKIDLVLNVSSTSGNNERVFINNGNNTFTDASIVYVNQTSVYGAFLAGDINKDGIVDFINIDRNQITITTALTKPYTTQNSTPSKLINLSALAQNVSAVQVLTAGFSITGSTPRTILIRAVGPTLTNYSVANVLSDPQLSLYSDNVLIAINSGWNYNTSINSAVGAFPLNNSKDAALFITLAPGAYTVQVKSATRNTGSALVEIYDVP